MLASHMGREGGMVARWYEMAKGKERRYRSLGVGTLTGGVGTDGKGTHMGRRSKVKGDEGPWQVVRMGEGGIGVGGKVGRKKGDGKSYGRRRRRGGKVV